MPCSCAWLMPTPHRPRSPGPCKTCLVFHLLYHFFFFISSKIWKSSSCLECLGHCLTRWQWRTTGWQWRRSTALSTPPLSAKSRISTAPAVTRSPSSSLVSLFFQLVHMQSHRRARSTHLNGTTRRNIHMSNAGIWFDLRAARGRALLSVFTSDLFSFFLFLLDIF